MKTPLYCAVLLTLFATGCSEDGTGAVRTAQADEHRLMTAEHMGELIQVVDEDAVQSGSSWFFQVEGLETTVVFDENADRMRIVIPIIAADELAPDMMLRMMQANFDSALDARYAIADGQVWGTFIHPLSSLSDEEFLVGLAQTANVVLTFGTSFSSGMFLFNGGDSGEIERQKLIEELRGKQRT